MKNHVFLLIIFLNINLCNANLTDDNYYSKLPDEQLCTEMNTINAHLNLINQEIAENRKKLRENITFKCKATTDFCWNLYLNKENEYEKHEKLLKDKLEKFHNFYKKLDTEIEKRLDERNEDLEKQEQLQKLLAPCCPEYRYLLQ